MAKRRKGDDSDGGIGKFIAAFALLGLIYVASHYGLLTTIGEAILSPLQPSKSDQLYPAPAEDEARSAQQKWNSLVRGRVAVDQIDDMGSERERSRPR